MRGYSGLQWMGSFLYMSFCFWAETPERSKLRKLRKRGIELNWWIDILLLAGWLPMGKANCYLLHALVFIQNLVIGLRNTNTQQTEEICRAVRKVRRPQFSVTAFYCPLYVIGDWFDTNCSAINLQWIIEFLTKLILFLTIESFDHFQSFLTKLIFSHLLILINYK